MKRRGAPEDVPQVIAIVQPTRAGKISLKKIVREFLQTGKDPLYIEMGEEVLLSAKPSPTAIPVEGSGSRIVLPQAVVKTLGLNQDTLLAILEREGAVALKRFEIADQLGQEAQIVDIENAYRVLRIAYTSPLPETLLPQLKARHSDLALRYNVRSFLESQETLAAWQARRRLGCPDEGDKALRQALVEERLAAQQENGSWEDQIPLTARHLCELADLGLTAEHPALARGAKWLLDRPQSEVNPGMWFGSDALVEAQAKVIADRRAGKGGRFREIRGPEQRQVIRGDDLIQKPCGPRIMWPNGLVIEAMLRLGYESHERIQTALSTMTTADWCECGYQHGVLERHGQDADSEPALEAFERICVDQYRFGGMRGPQALAEADLAHQTNQIRTAYQETIAGDEYPLRMPDHIQGCEFITTRSLSQVQDPFVRRFAEAHLWRFAGIQHGPNGTFPEEQYGTGFGQIGILEAVARYNHPASKVMVERALPWVVNAQNEDGSWGEGTRRDVTTLAVVNALLSVEDTLPEGMRP